MHVRLWHVRLWRGHGEFCCYHCWMWWQNFKTLILSWAALCWQRKCESDGKLRAELLTRTLELTILVVDCAQWLTASFASYYLTVEMMLLVINPVCFYACSTLVRAWGVLLSLLNVMTKLQNPNSQLSIPLLTKEVWVWWQAACRTLDKNSWHRFVLGPVVFSFVLCSPELLLYLLVVNEPLLFWCLCRYLSILRKPAGQAGKLFFANVVRD